MTSLMTMAAFALDWILGDPQRWPHPVRLVGALVGFLERRLRSLSAMLQSASPAPSPALPRLFGVFLALTVVAATGLLTWSILSWAGRLSAVLWYLLCLYLVYTAICLKDLTNHARAVERALDGADLEEARRALSWIVGRDTGTLDEAGIRRALVETLAENFADGLAAPLFYLALGGPVLAWMYKAVNTLDSMVGYKSDMYIHLGMFSAKLDDAANFIPSRLAALLIVLAARLGRFDWGRAMRLWLREGRLHSSPNSGQTEAAMAGALGVWLGGPSSYGGTLVVKPVIGSGLGETGAGAVKSAERILIIATCLMVALAALWQTLSSLSGLYPYGWGI